MPEPKHIRVETLTELQIWIEGQFALIAQSQKTAHEDLTNIRKTVHDQANMLAALIACNLPDRVKQLEDSYKLHTSSLEKFRDDLVARKATITLLRFVYIAGGAILGSLATAWSIIR